MIERNSMDFLKDVVTYVGEQYDGKDVIIGEYLRMKDESEPGVKSSFTVIHYSDGVLFKANPWNWNVISFGKVVRDNLVENYLGDLSVFHIGEHTSSRISAEKIKTEINITKRSVYGSDEFGVPNYHYNFARAYSDCFVIPNPLLFDRLNETDIIYEQNFDRFSGNVQKFGDCLVDVLR